LVNEKTKLVFCNHVSNALGTVNPVEEIIAKAHAFNAAVLLDGAQATPHIKPDVQALDVDFYVASAHKLWFLLRKQPMQACLINLKRVPQIFVEVLHLVLV
jgi:selenocysteine lyase/cysteine desulfurase